VISGVANGGTNVLQLVQSSSDVLEFGKQNAIVDQTHAIGNR
jgi:hypothetical protein